jgi:hypothetical protein
MKRALMFASAMLLLANALPVAARAQGAIIETLDDLKDVAEAPGFRGALPANVDLSATLPPPGDQGSSGSCTSWAVTYGAASQALRRAGLGSSLRLSPAFTYNRVGNDPICQLGTAASVTLNMLRDVGGLPFEKYVFDAGWCGRVPSSEELQQAARYRIKGWTKISDAKKVEDVKAQLARGVPVIFDMHVSEQFEQFKGNSVLDIPGVMSGGGHTMLAIGYDDSRKAFRIQNSWGRKFGEGGYAWLSYDFWVRNVGLGYVID